ncbi:4-phosphoerythronate dehydrogenase [Rheinheimera baltica]|uniref:4-phosphoerythronate dehydrogenase n=2 Tax=Rheinheimera baltica TaxID=67576 RepID=UPI00041DD94E|nr:4-phosphoerythronate dehydrogenase [Rheinheimera baltica]
MQIFADENMPLVNAFFEDIGDVTLFNGRNVTASQLENADILLVRSVTNVNAELLAKNSKLKFVGTATIGMDHIDQAYLASRNVSFASAPGCNAQSVVEYVLSSLWCLAERYQWHLEKKTVGIVGVGNIGSRLVRALTALNIKVLQCDPVRAEQDNGFEHTDFDLLCQHADIISFHTPLQTLGKWPTRHMLNTTSLQRLKPDCAIINASRGAVIDNHALLNDLLVTHRRRAVVLDVWESEPDILTALLPYVDIATAHIAGHSVEGKARGTEMLYQHCCKLLGQPVIHQLGQVLSVPAMEKLQISEKFRLPDVQNLARLLYDVRRDDAMLRQHLAEQGFDWLRKHYPPRREFGSLQLCGKIVPDYLPQLGFSLAQ